MATSNKRADYLHARRIFWTKHVHIWKNSDLSMRQYAKQNNLCNKSLSFWKCKLEKEQTTSPDFVQVPKEFIPQHPLQDYAETHIKVSNPQSFVLEVLDYKLQIPSGFDSTDLVHILDCLRKISCF